MAVKRILIPNRNLHYAKFLLELGRYGRRAKATLYYPGAGIDLDAFMMTGLREAVFVDPAYFSAAPTRYRRNSLRQIILSRDRRARFSSPNRRTLNARFTLKGQSHRVTFLRGMNGDMPERRTTRPIVYLAKGSLLPDLLCPPLALTSRTILAYGVDVLELPMFSDVVRQVFSGKRFEQRWHGSTLYIFAKYRYNSKNIDRVRQSLSELGSA